MTLFDPRLELLLTFGPCSYKSQNSEARVSTPCSLAAAIPRKVCCKLRMLRLILRTPAALTPLTYLEAYAIKQWSTSCPRARKMKLRKMVSTITGGGFGKSLRDKHVFIYLWSSGEMVLWASSSNSIRLVLRSKMSESGSSASLSSLKSPCKKRGLHYCWRISKTSHDFGRHTFCIEAPMLHMTLHRISSLMALSTISASCSYVCMIAWYRLQIRGFFFSCQ